LIGKRLRYFLWDSIIEARISHSNHYKKSGP